MPILLMGNLKTMYVFFLYFNGHTVKHIFIELVTTLNLLYFSRETLLYINACIRENVSRLNKRFSQ